MYENPVVTAIDNELPLVDILAKIIVYTTPLSVIVHGLTANPLARRIGREVEG